MDHPNLSQEINDLINSSDETNGVFVDKLPVGTRLIVNTKNTKYNIVTLGAGDKDGCRIQIQGGRFFPTPTECFLNGSTWGGSMLKIYWIGVDMFMELWHEKTITTSAVESIQIIKE